MTDKIYGRVFDSSTAGWIADLIISGEIANYEASIGALWNYEAIQDASILSIGDGFLKESSLGPDFVWSGGLLDVSIISADASVQDLYVYVEDLSTYTYSHTHAQDASIAELYNEIENLPQDASITDLYNYTLDLSTRLDNFDPAQDSSISDLYSIKADKTEIYSKSYIDGSLNKKSTFNPLSTGGRLAKFENNNGRIGPSLNIKETAAGLHIEGLVQQPIEESAFKNVLVSSYLGILRYRTDLVFEASLNDYATLTYVDGSLNLKQNLIPAGTYVKEASLGTSFIWNAGILDVSVEGGSSSQDASIGELFVYVEDLSIYTYSHTHTQDASIGDLYSKIENLPQDASITDLYNYTLDLSTRLDNFDPAQDASIGKLFIYVEDLSTYTYSHTHAQDASIEDLYDSIGYLTNWNLSQDASLILKTDKTYVDASLNVKVNQTLFDTSIASLTGWNLSQDASIILKADKTYVDSSLNAKVNQSLFDASISTFSVKVSNLESSIGTLNAIDMTQNSSINELFLITNQQDASLNDIIDITNLYVPNASLGTTLVWTGGVLDVQFPEQDASISNLYVYVEDLSTYTYSHTHTQDASITDLYVYVEDLSAYTYSHTHTQDASIEDLYSLKLGVNDASSLYAKRLVGFTSCVSTYTVNASDNLNVIDASGTYTITFPNTLETGFSTTVINIGTGVLTLNASTLLSIDSSVALRDKYGAASVIHKGSGIFYAIGNLK